MSTNLINFQFKFLSNNQDNLTDSVKIEQIYLAKNNPRYTLIKINENLKDFISQDTEGDYDEKEIFSSLLSQEGDYSDLLKLLNSIYENDFTNKYDPIYLIKTKQKFVVAEGNRRIMCLKLINGDLKLEEKHNFLNGFVKNIIAEINEPFSPRNNYKNCVNLINKIREKLLSDQKAITVYCRVVEDEAELWSILYNDKHLTGERTGLRKWSRGKYFADLINIFPTGINEKSKAFTKIKQNFQRDLNKIKEDYKNALFIYSIIDVAKFESKFINGNPWAAIFNNENILEEMILIEGISALELKHSFAKIRKIICEEILNIDLKIFEKEYFAIDFPETENFVIDFSEKKIKTENLLNFIYKKWKAKIITTRQIAKEKYQDFINDLLVLLDGKNYLNSLTREELQKINFFNLSNVALDNIIKANIIQHPDLVEIFQSYKNIKQKNQEFIKWAKENFLVKKINTLRIEPKYVFYNLIDQAISIDPKFLNAKAATFRSILEQITIWTGFDKVKDASQEEQEEYIKYFIANKKPSLYKSYSIKTDEDFNNFITEFTDFSMNDPFIKAGKEKFFGEEIKHFMNNCIHSFHYIYFSPEKQKFKATEIIKKFEIYQDNILELLKHLKMDKFNQMNELMIQILAKSDVEYQQFDKLA